MVEGGRQLYVDPAAFVPNSRGEVLLAGGFTLLTTLSPEGRVSAVATDSVFGAVILPDGSARIVDPPIEPRLMSGVRAAARGDGGWDVVFARVKPYAGEQRPDTAASLWYGVYDGRRWTHLEQLSLPPVGTVRPLFASSLLRRGDTLAWAVNLVPPSGPMHVALFERRGGRWSHEVIPTFQVRPELGYSDSLGLVLALVQPDSTVREGDGNSLFVWARRPHWKRLRRVTLGSVDGHVYVPSVTTSPRGTLVTWHATVPAGNRIEARAVIGRLEDENPVITLDENAAWGQYPVAPVVLSSDLHIWVTHHVPDERRREIRFVRDSARTAVTIGRIPSPYKTDRLAAAATTSGRLLVTGLEYDRQRHFVASLLIRAQIACRSSAR